MPTDRRNLAWLIVGLMIWVVTVVFAGSQQGPTGSGAGELFVSRLAIGGIALSLFPLLYVFAIKDGKRIGLTRLNAGRALVMTILVTVVYSVVRNGLIVFVPSTVPYLEASAIQVAEAMKLGQFGGSVVSPSLLLPVMLVGAFAGAAGAEVFYRGFLFNRIKEQSHWSVALLGSAALFGFLHYFNVGMTGLIMGVVVSLIAGWLMERYNNLVAPVLFHYLQYVGTILVFYYLVL